MRFVFTSIFLFNSLTSSFFRLDDSLYISLGYIFTLNTIPLIKAVPCLIIGGFILFQIEKLIASQADSESKVNMIKELKISAVLFVLAGFWILLNEYFLEYNIASIILKWTLFPLYAYIFDLIHDDRFFADPIIIFIQNILFCFIPIMIFILSVYFIRTANKLDEIKGDSPNLKLNLFIKIILIVLIGSNVVVLGFVLSVMDPSVYFISGIALNVIFLYALLKKRKWGFYGYIIASAVGFFVASNTHGDPAGIWGLIPCFLIFFSLNLGGGNNGWKQLS